MPDTPPPRPLGPASALTLLCAGALLTGCAAGAHPQRPLSAPQALLLQEPAAPALRLATAYGPGASAPPAAPTPAPSRRATHGHAHSRPAAPSAPAAPRPEVRQQPEYGDTVCDLAESYGRWAEGGPQDTTCLSLYG